MTPLPVFLRSFRDRTLRTVTPAGATIHHAKQTSFRQPSVLVSLCTYCTYTSFLAYQFAEIISWPLNFIPKSYFEPTCNPSNKPENTSHQLLRLASRWSIWSSNIMLPWLNTYNDLLRSLQTKFNSPYLIPRWPGKNMPKHIMIKAKRSEASVSWLWEWIPK